MSKKATRLAAPKDIGGASAFVRLRSQYANACIIQRHPSLRDTLQYFIPSHLADADIAEISLYAQVWKAKFYQDGSSVPETTQYYRVLVQPMTIAQLSSTTLPNLATAVPCADGFNGDRHCSSKDNYLNPSDGTVVMTAVELKSYPAEPVENAHLLSVMQLAP